MADVGTSQPRRTMDEPLTIQIRICVWLLAALAFSGCDCAGPVYIGSRDEPERVTPLLHLSCVGGRTAIDSSAMGPPRTAPRPRRSSGFEPASTSNEKLFS